MGLIKDYFNQTSKPEGALGKLMIHSMNIGHSVLSKWALAHLTTIRPTQIVDIGCGGGKNIAACAGEEMRKDTEPDTTAVSLMQALQFQVRSMISCQTRM